ncbi:MAG: thiamine-phosphate kinase [Ignavibacteriae bacterium]|nr:thiamine-phosphate kinase [Ignavibacteria bacterium]MBI3363923.1 thiamine-phosphate kinase [Ignavibacteriota bacterium]
MEQKHTTITSIGEFALIDRIKEIVNVRVDDASLHDQLRLGISDDAAVYRPTPGKVQLLTTDAFIEGVHFDLLFTTFRHLGWKVMAASFSDIAAMGGAPRYAALTLSLPQKISIEMVEELYRGITFACKKYSCLVIGGDTTAASGNTMISATIIGEAVESNVIQRRGAKPGDYVCVTGHLGASLSGLKILLREKNRFAQAVDPSHFRAELEPYAPAIEKHLMPKPRLDISKILSEQVQIHAMIDISDGLASEVHHLCAYSGVGASIYEHNLPVESITQRIADEFSESPAHYALYGGEEYELLFTLTDEEFAKLDRLTNDVTIIGRITEKEKGIELVHENGEHEALPFGGWDHFSSR